MALMAAVSSAFLVHLLALKRGEGVKGVESGRGRRFRRSWEVDKERGGDGHGVMCVVPVYVGSS